MGYQENADRYADTAWRARAQACIAEQGAIFAGDGRPDIAALGVGVVGNDVEDVEAVIRQTSVANVAGDWAEDGTMRGAVQGVWPAVAAARYPQPAAVSDGRS